MRFCLMAFAITKLKRLIYKHFTCATDLGSVQIIFIINQLLVFITTTAFSDTRIGISKELTTLRFVQNGQLRSSQKSLGQTMVPAIGDDAAYIAFDQGQYITAKRIAERRAKQGDPQAHTLLGRIYSEGLGVARDQITAAKWYRAGAKLGDIEAIFALGVILANNNYINKDYNEASKMFEQAARAGHAFAHYNLAQLFLSGRGKPDNPFRAAQHLEYAAKNGIPQAQYDLSALYQRGYGVKPDAYKAAFWLQKAADKGMPVAQFEYAVNLILGRGFNRDKSRIVEYLTAAASSGIAAAQNRLAYLYHFGITGTSRNAFLAAKWHWLAKQNGIRDEKIDAFIAKYPRKILRKAIVAAKAQQAEVF
ncbi:MAG: Secretory immunoglobulin A-binding protein EsiB [Hyphomicrobiaceae bacterium hypho_1]